MKSSCLNKFFVFRFIAEIFHYLRLGCKDNQFLWPTVAGIIKHQANHIIDHEKSGSASGTGSS